MFSGFISDLPTLKSSLIYGVIFYKFINISLNRQTSIVTFSSLGVVVACKAFRNIWKQLCLGSSMTAQIHFKTTNNRHLTKLNNNIVTTKMDDSNRMLTYLS